MERHILIINKNESFKNLCSSGPPQSKLTLFKVNYIFYLWLGTHICGGPAELVGLFSSSQVVSAPNIIQGPTVRSIHFIGSVSLEGEPQYSWYYHHRFIDNLREVW